MSFEHTSSTGTETGDELPLFIIEENQVVVSYFDLAEREQTPETADYEAILMDNQMTVELARASSRQADEGEQVWPLKLAAPDGTHVLEEGEHYPGPLDPHNRMMLYKLFGTSFAELEKSNVRDLPNGETVTTVPLNDRAAIVEYYHMPEGDEESPWTSLSVVTLKPEQHPEDGLAAVHEDLLPGAFDPER